MAFDLSQIAPLLQMMGSGGGGGNVSGGSPVSESGDGMSLTQMISAAQAMGLLGQKKPQPGISQGLLQLMQQPPQQQAPPTFGFTGQQPLIGSPFQRYW